MLLTKPLILVNFFIVFFVYVYHKIGLQFINNILPLLKKEGIFELKVEISCAKLSYVLPCREAKY